MKKLFLLLSIISLAYSYDGDIVKYEYYKVHYSEPVYDLVRKKIPYQECWDERVSYGRAGNDGTGGALLGGIAGGALGSTMGEGSGKTAAIIGGALLGTMTGQSMAQRPDTRRDEIVQRCNTRYEIREERELVGYRNFFRIDGVEKYKFAPTRLDAIRVEVSYRY